MPFVISAGQLSATSAPSSSSYSALSLSDDYVLEYGALYRSNASVQTVISFLARNIAQLGLHTFRRVSDTDRVRVTDHPLPKLLGSPSPGVTRYQLVEGLISDLCIYGDAYLLKARMGAETFLVRLPPDRISLSGSSWWSAGEYTLVGGRGRVSFPAADIVHVHGYNPIDQRRGLSPLESLRSVLAEEYEAGKYRKDLWRNAARPGGVLTRPAGAPKWSDEAFNRFKSSWASYAGNGTSVGGTPILEDGMEFAPLSITPESAQYIEARKLTMVEVANAYHVPPTMVGLMEGATFSNITEQHKMLYQDTLGPIVEMVTEVLEAQLLPDFPDTDGLYLEFNIQEKLRGSFEEQAAAASTATGRPWMTANEQRARMNLPRIDGGDSLVTPLNVLVGGQASPRDADSTTPGAASRSVQGKAGHLRLEAKARADETAVEKATEVLSAFIDRQGKSILSAIGAGTFEWDEKRWNRELSDELFALNVLLSTQAGQKALEALGLDAGTWDQDATLAWLRKNADGVAEGFNGATRVAVEEAIASDADDEDHDPVSAVKSAFVGAIAARATQAAVAQTTAISGFGTREAASRTGRAMTKTWKTLNSNPRKTHARLDGETVPLDETFSNGARWPGDSRLDADERAHCDCDMTVAYEED